MSSVESNTAAGPGIHAGRFIVASAVLKTAAAFIFCIIANTDSSHAEVGKGDEVNEHAKKIAAIHQLVLKKPVKHMVLSKKKLLSRIKELVFIDYTREEIIDEGRMMVRLGLFPAGTDYQETIFQLLEEQVVGLYDTHSGELLLVDYLPDIMQDTTVDHEITHAVQDQNFNLKFLMKRRKGEGDKKYAVSAVFEGDALIMEEMFMGGGLPDSLTPEGIENMMVSMSDKSSKVFKVPSNIRKSLFFPYSYGYVFMKKVFKQGGYNAVNSVLADPPESTEQIIHPGAYFNDDDPEKVSFKIPSEVLSHYRVAMENVMGEFSLKVWLEEFIDPLEAGLAADGWEGDWYYFLWPKSDKIGKKHLGKGVFVMVAEWEKGKADAHPDATQFFKALDKVVTLRWKPVKTAAGEGMKVYKNLCDEWIIIKQDGDRVLFIEGLPAGFYPDPGKTVKKLLKSVK